VTSGPYQAPTSAQEADWIVNVFNDLICGNYVKRSLGIGAVFQSANMNRYAAVFSSERRSRVEIKPCDIPTRVSRPEQKVPIAAADVEQAVSSRHCPRQMPHEVIPFKS
jgi:hypothetical protein